MDKKSILVVDDDEMTRLLLRQTLSQKRYTILEAEDGSRALALFNKHAPDMVLLDVELPKLNGFEVCKLIRESAHGRDVPVVMITGMDDTESIELAYRIGATDFIVKPINWSLIGHHLRYVLRASNNFEALKESERRLEHAQQIARLGHWELHGGQDRLILSRQLTDMFSLPCTQFEHGMDYLVKLIHPAERLRVKTVLKKALDNAQRFQLDVRGVLPDNRVLYVHLHGQLLAESTTSKPVLSGIMQDVTELRRSQERLTYIAHHDALTNLPNRIMFQQQMEQAIQRANRFQRKAALLFIDLDRFKGINDSLGHDIGDALLRGVAERIRGSIRKYDTVARLGGDEFAVILDAIENKQDAMHFAKRAIRIFEQPFYLDNKMLYVEASIGISVYPDNGKTPEKLLRNADMAMYQAKRSEMRELVFYTDKLTESTRKRWSLENDLRKALEENRFILMYQPKVDPDSGDIIGVEALLRWKKGKSPSEFIPIAEETGLIIPLGEWVIKQAINQLHIWKGTACGHLTIAVNVSGRQLYNQELSSYIKTMLDLKGINANQLELEITEEYLIQDSAEGSCQKTLSTLSDLGIKMAIDDFGTGYSSFSQLKSLPISTLKIDKSFVDNIPEDQEAVAIIKSIVSLAKNLRLQVIAEGVETSEQLACIRSYGCDLVQGYFYCKPVVAKEILTMVEQARGQRTIRLVPCEE